MVVKVGVDGIKAVLLHDVVPYILHISGGKTVETKRKTFLPQNLTVVKLEPLNLFQSAVDARQPLLAYL